MGLLDFFGDFLNDTPWTESERPSFADSQMSDLLPYRVYDPTSNLFYNKGSVGFVLEIAPVVNGDSVRTVQSALQNYCPPGGTVQFINWASPNLEKPLSAWAQRKTARTALTTRIVEKRRDHLTSMRLGTDHTVKCIPHVRRVFVAGWLEGQPAPAMIKKLEELRRNMILAFGGDALSRNLPPAEFLDLLCELFHCRGDRLGEQAAYDPDIPLNYQIPGAGVIVERTGLSFMSEPDLSVSSASVHIVPSEWSFALGSLFHGAPERPSDAPHGPVLISMTAKAIPQQESTADLLKRRAKIAHSEGTKFHKFMPDLPELKREVEGLHADLERGERMFDTLTTVSAYARGSVLESGTAMSEMRKIFGAVGITLQEDNFVQLPVFLCALPFGASGQLLRDMRKAGRMRKRKGQAVTALAPLHGEWTGSGSFRSMLLVGRQGQLFDWDPFKSSGNYNVSVVGASGAGKSVFMQELAGSIYAASGRVLIIDDGYSFQNLCDMFEGRWVGIGKSGSIRLNPFSMLNEAHMADDDYRSEVLQLITRVVASMANLGEQREGRVGGIEEEYIQSACAMVWDRHRRAGSITDVRDALAEEARKEPRLADVVMKISRFSRDGIYGAFFDGPANISVDNPMTVFELSELKTQKDLEAVVLQIIMFLGTELMFKTPRDTRVAIIIDEAWDMLGGSGTAHFLQGVVRRARKYTGALITGTQSIEDYFDNSAAKVCYENSDWTVLMQQKSEVVDKLVADGRLAVNQGTAYALKTLTKVDGAFAELAIKGADGWAFGRLVVDPYSLAAYSTKGETVQLLKSLRKDHGLSLADAIELMVENGKVQ